MTGIAGAVPAGLQVGVLRAPENPHQNGPRESAKLSHADPDGPPRHDRHPVRGVTGGAERRSGGLAERRDAG